MSKVFAAPTARRPYADPASAAKEILLGWQAMKHVTLRSAFWGRGSFDGDHDAFSPLVVGEALRKYAQLESLRVLGVSSSGMEQGLVSLFS